MNGVKKRFAPNTMLGWKLYQQPIINLRNANDPLSMAKCLLTSSMDLILGRQFSDPDRCPGDFFILQIFRWQCGLGLGQIRQTIGLEGSLDTRRLDVTSPIFIVDIKHTNAGPLPILLYFIAVLRHCQRSRPQAEAGFVVQTRGALNFTTNTQQRFGLPPRLFFIKQCLPIRHCGARLTALHLSVLGISFLFALGSELPMRNERVWHCVQTGSPPSASPL